MRKKRSVIIAVALLAAVACGCAVCNLRRTTPAPGGERKAAVTDATRSGAPQEKPLTPHATSQADWAKPVEKPGVPNLYKVTGQLYRSAQPTAEGMRELKNMGIKTVVNLRLFHSDRGEIGETELAYEHIPMEVWDADDEEFVRFLKIVTDENRTPVLVHCQHGSDRTGTAVAVYRIAVCGWARRKQSGKCGKVGSVFTKCGRGSRNTSGNSTLTPSSAVPPRSLRRQIDTPTGALALLPAPDLHAGKLS